MNVRTAALAAALTAFTPVLLEAQESATGARARALGGASTAFSDDPHCIWINPAGTAAQPGGIAISYESTALYEERPGPFISRAPARPRSNDPVFLPSFFGIVYQIGGPDLPQALGLGLATPYHLYHPFRGPDPGPGDPPSLTIEQAFTRLRLSYAVELPLAPRDARGFLTRLSLGVGVDLATTRFEFTAPPDNEQSPIDHDLAVSGGFGLQLGLYDNGENVRANFGLSYQGPADFGFGHDLSIPSGVAPFYDWPQQIQAGLALYLFDRLPLRLCLEAQWTDWKGAAQKSQLAGTESFASSWSVSAGAEYRFDLSPTIGLLPRVGMKRVAAPWNHASKPALPAWGHYQLFIDSRSDKFFVVSFGVGLSWGYAEGTQDTLDLAFDIGGDAPGVALSYTFQF